MTNRTVVPTNDIGILCGVALMLIMGCVVLGSVGIPVFQSGTVLSSALLYLSSWIALFVGQISIGLWKHRPDSPIAYIRDHEFSPEYRRRLLHALPILLALTVYMPMFSAFKSSIPLFNPFQWDQTFIAWDRAIFGQDAWLWMQPVLGYPVVTSIISIFYHLWILLLYVGSVYFAIYVTDKPLRQQYFMAYFLTWTIVGIAMATWLSSVGPCFLLPLTGDPAFIPQMEYLRAADQHYPVMVLPVQQALLDWQASGQFGLGRGITAMPSMHVAMVVLFWLGMRRISRLAGIAAAIFALIIALGSVHLGYHYAVDGIVAAAVTLVIWPVAGWLSTTRIGALQAGKPARSN
ncbi:phosphatase PAP2 family protein [Altererythrobacter aquiaggeris]|uniref:phosphatase PAP2 family protein n=1 Tax=Aestuarierythrobacter aquiaggeris TaxID=1898396 RepID=UPI00301A8AEA